MAFSSCTPAAVKRGLISVVSGFGIVALVLGLSSGAQAAPKPTIASVTAQLNALGHQNERLAEQYNKAGIDEALKQKQANHAAQLAKKAQAAYLKSKALVRFDLVEQYKGGSLSSTAALLTSRSSQNYLDQLSTLSLISARRTAITHQLDAQKNAAAKASDTAAQLLASATKIRKALGVARANLTARVAQYTKLLSRLNAAQRARFLAIKQAKAKAVAQAPVTAAKTKAQVRTVSALGPVPAPSGRAAIAVKYALAQIGKPYVFAAAGPRAFDCSGLTMMAWKAAGVSLPHLAAAQFNMGHHVARSQLEPGDLVFFYPGIQHVAMYIGHGLVVHAPHTGDVVRIAPLSQFDGNYDGAIRLP